MRPWLSRDHTDMEYRSSHSPSPGSSVEGRRGRKQGACWGLNQKRKGLGDEELKEEEEE